MFQNFFFNVENFFFISLAIIFVLVMLLVYLFKQRISTVEKTGNTMFDMVRRLADEVKWLRGTKTPADNNANVEKCLIGEEPVYELPVKSVPEVEVLPTSKETIEYEIVEIPIASVPSSSSNKIVVEDLGDSDTDSEHDSDSEEFESEYDSDEDPEPIQVLHIEAAENKDIHLDLDVDLDLETIEQEPSISEPNEQPVSEPNEQPVSEPNEQPVSEPNEQPVSEPNEPEQEHNNTPEEIEIEVNDIEDAFVTDKEQQSSHFSVEELKKMDIKHLRQLAAEKTGQDVSKIKKNELVRILTTTTIQMSM